VTDYFVEFVCHLFPKLPWRRGFPFSRHRRLRVPRVLPHVNFIWLWLFVAFVEEVVWGRSRQIRRLTSQPNSERTKPACTSAGYAIGLTDDQAPRVADANRTCREAPPDDSPSGISSRSLASFCQKGIPSPVLPIAFAELALITRDLRGAMLRQ
jgi:hypothetical protein